MQRIAILGNSGSGKSTLAREIGQRLDVPVVHLDPLFWEPGWIEPDDEVFRERVRQAIAGDAWVCEGNYSQRTFDLRLPRTDLIIWLETPRLTCLRRVIMRSALNRPRADLPAGCTERLDKAFLGFLKYVWHFDRVNRPGSEARRMAIAPQIPVIHLSGTRQILAFVAGLNKPARGHSIDSDNVIREAE
ncbi:AAA family ATPase [Pseudomonas anatoliensis]|uniref:AAA family ATPase n=1 Tax=Pseudomonas anatoliensis TaxID=2710589 RepID=UPI001B324B79|nr:AAA family ATPase [Pseudomonas anatoliensis]MBP5959242.1 AAA family ATPase [Pseudomonas anatoliensis]